ncbi:MAG: GNAT family N-acetyltransferase [Deltaproteobacteria bacterium]|nr:GNAT family N-acetyltransferase [Deltaproteobacteria bacterium]
MPLARFAIRNGTAADLDRLVAIAGADAHGSFTRATFESELQLSWSHVEVLELVPEGAAVGLLVWWWVAGEIELLYVATDASHRRQGVALALVRHLLARAVELGALRVMLEVRHDNAGARALYERLGFVVVGVRPRYYRGGEDAVLLDWRAC